MTPAPFQDVIVEVYLPLLTLSLGSVEVQALWGDRGVPAAARRRLIPLQPPRTAWQRAMPAPVPIHTWQTKRPQTKS